MAFDEVQFPLKVAYGSGGGPQFSTDIVTIDGGFERRNQNWSQARRSFDARTGIRSVADGMVLLAFFQARAGRARGFRVRDWMDYSSALDGISAVTALDQAIGSGDGAKTSFQLVKKYGSGGVFYTREIKKPVAGSVLVAVGGVVLSSGWSLDETRGVLSFASPPASGASVTAGFLFDVPVRFDTDQLSLQAYDPHLQQASLPLIEIRIV